MNPMLEEYWRIWFDKEPEALPPCTCCHQVPTVRPYLDLTVAQCDCARTASGEGSSLREEWDKRNTRLRLAERTERDMPPCPKCSQQPKVFGPVDDGVYLVSCATGCRSTLTSRSLGDVKYRWRQWVEQETRPAETPDVGLIGKGLVVDFSVPRAPATQALKFLQQRVREIADATGREWFGNNLDRHGTWASNMPHPVPLHHPLGLLRNEPGMREAAATVAPRPLPARNCAACAEPEHTGRKLFPHFPDSSRRFVLTCGDCIASGVPLAKQPVEERPHLDGYHAWETPSWEGFGSL